MTTVGHEEEPGSSAGHPVPRDGGSGDAGSAEPGALGTLSAETPSAETLRAETLRAEQAQEQKLRTETFAASLEQVSASALGGLSSAQALLEQVPESRNDKSEWLRSFARDVEISLHLVRGMGLPVAGLDEPFSSPFNPNFAATLTRARNGDIVCHDPSLAILKREFQTLPELAAALRSGNPRRLRPLLHALWRVRMLFEADLLRLPFVDVPQLKPGSPQPAFAAQSGFEVLVRCRWFLDAGASVAFSRSFAEGWCPLDKRESRRAIYELLRQRVMVKVDEVASNYRNATHLYLPGEIPDDPGGPEPISWD
jgi:hypothetical protein